jgi:SRSO17 transposase
VFLGYASSQGHALLDRELYLPKSWTEEAVRCAVAGVPDGREFATKPELARQMLARALAAGVPAAWVTGDEVYGDHRALRGWLEQRHQAYVLAVACDEAVGLDAGPVSAAVVGLRLPASAWQCHSAGAGAKGPRLYDWASVPLAEPTAAGWQAALLLRRSLSDPDEQAYYRVFAPAGTPLTTLVQVAGCRWTIETGFEEAKGNVGLDHYEVRNWAGWYRHITLAMLAHAFLAVIRTQVTPDAEKKTAPMPPLSIPARPSSSA